ncbi:S8 family serine peptidase [Lentzea tibetensis]|uniref:S8 family serine peptidase n=1 Tax=Lentzea tibetensis TaxID=2591470 RepID=A0A563EQ44_9PSEU|nr:S8 family serine peptidase [Lentzea tibetensis]TWP49543.1 S8 family serine peptidase [Lentzea tibetensis]
MSQAVNRLTAQHGTLFVVAAGNSGPSDESIGSPAAADSALTVGAVDRQDGLAEFSSRGPRWVNGAIKPDITAPGVGIVAARAANSSAGKPGETHFAASGTSMATPHVAGAAAILAAQHPDWTPEQLKSALMASSKPNDTLTAYQQGAGRVDVARATTLRVTPSAGSLSLGTALWPHHDDAPIEKTVTYRNTGATPVTFALTTALTDQSGKPAVAGIATVEPSTITVPAGGEASAKLTVRTSVESPDGRYSGALVASDGTTAVRTPIGFTKEVESYDVNLSFLDFDGKPTDQYFYRFVSHAQPKAFLRYDPSGTLTQRIPKGEYYYEAYVQTTGRRGLTQIVEPAFEVSGNSSFVNDARVGEQPGFTTEQPNAKIGSADLQFGMRLKWGDTGLSMYLRDFEGFLVRPATTSAPGAFTYGQSAVLAEPDGSGGFAGSPYLYHLTFQHDSTVPKGLVRKVSDRSLAVVHSEVASHTKGATAERDGVARGAVPLKIKEFYTPNTPWYGSVLELDNGEPFPPLTSQQSATPRSFKLGRPVTERWNQAVFGPAFPKFPLRLDRWAGRGGDQISISLPMFADQSATHFGTSKISRARTVLYRGDTVVSESPYQGYIYTPVPAERTAYRLHAEAARDGISELSTKITADWGFTSGHAAGDQRAVLPLLAVRFAPTLDIENRARAGNAFTFPMYVQRNGSDQVTDVKAPVVQVSYDDGAKWQPAHLVRIGDRWLVTVKHPKDAKFVSLKAQARDASGNTVDQTIIRAYGLK